MLFNQEDKLFLQRCQTSVLIPADPEGSLDDILGGEADPQVRSTLYFGALNKQAPDKSLTYSQTRRKTESTCPT